MAEANEKKQETVMSVEPLYQRYKEWVLQKEKSKLTTMLVVGTLISAGVIAGVTLVPMIPAWAYPFIVFPIGIFLFLGMLAIAFRSAEANPDRLTIKERWSFKRRIRVFAVVAIIFVTLLLGARTYIPEAVGGAITIAALLGLYNAIRRSPDEIRLDAEGIADPRDVVEEYEERKEYFIPEEELDDLDDEDFYDELTEKGR